MKELLEQLERLGLANDLPVLLAARAGAVQYRPLAWLLWEEAGLVEGDRLTAKGDRVVHHLLGLADALDVRL